MQLHSDISGAVLGFGTDKPYGSMMQFGGITSPNSMIPGVEIPARPYLGISAEDEVEILSCLSKNIVIIRRAAINWCQCFFKYIF
jgi:phage gpG-like protein